MHARVSRLAARLALCVGGKLALPSGVCEANIKPIARATALLRSFGLLREPIQRGLLAAALRQLSAHRRSSCAAQLCFADGLQ
jgi:hypothetical protein